MICVYFTALSRTSMVWRESRSRATTCKVKRVVVKYGKVHRTLNEAKGAITETMASELAAIDTKTSGDRPPGEDLR